jgi:hypothetical protein
MKYCKNKISEDEYIDLFTAIERFIYRVFLIENEAILL